MLGFCEDSGPLMSKLSRKVFLCFLTASLRGISWLGIDHCESFFFFLWNAQGTSIFGYWLYTIVRVPSAFGGEPLCFWSGPHMRYGIFFDRSTFQDWDETRLQVSMIYSRIWRADLANTFSKRTLIWVKSLWSVKRDLSLELNQCEMSSLSTMEMQLFDDIWMALVKKCRLC